METVSVAYNKMARWKCKLLGNPSRDLIVMQGQFWDHRKGTFQKNRCGPVTVLMQQQYTYTNGFKTFSITVICSKAK